MSDEDREALIEALAQAMAHLRLCQSRTDPMKPCNCHLSRELEVIPLLPVVETIARRRAAEAVQPFRELFAGGPDTSCRTTWRRDSLADMPGTSDECVEVPMADLRDAFDRAEALTHHEETL